MTKQLRKILLSQVKQRPWNYLLLAPDQVIVQQQQIYKYLYVIYHHLISKIVLKNRLKRQRISRALLYTRQKAPEHIKLLWIST